jgi:hypothetical protein
MPESRIPLEELLPIIRRVLGAGTSPGDSVDDLVAIYPDRLILFATKCEQKLPDAAFESEGALALLSMKPHGPVLNLKWQEIERMECSSRQFYGNRLSGSREEGREFRLHTQQGSARFFLPEEDAELARNAFATLLGEHYTEDAAMEKYRPARRLPRRKERSRTNQESLWLLILIGFFAIVGLLLDQGGRESSDFAAIPFGLAALLLLFLLLNLVLGGIRSLGYENQYKRRRRVEKLRAKRVRQDLSKRQPLRSSALGWTLKVIGALMAICGVVTSNLVIFAVTDERGQAGGWVSMIFFLAAILSLAAISLIYTGYRLGQRPAQRALKDDSRPPILFLRPFEVDGRTDLNPHGLLAQLLGIEALGWFKRLGPIGNIHPLRILRLFFSVTADHSEEQMARYFRRHGPFVAIGRPGERFSLGGAARLYVSDEMWQTAVLDLLDHSQFVVLQPSTTPGVRWEIEQTAKLVAPERILLCLMWFAGSQARYDQFRLHFAPATRLRLPRPLGDGSFACFDKEGNGALLPLRLRAPITWPIFGCAVNFAETFRPFFSRLKGRAEPPAPVPGRFSWFAQGLLACLFWLPLLRGVNFIAATATARLQHEHKEFVARREWSQNAKLTVVESGPGWSWSLRSAWHRDPANEHAPNMRLYVLGDDVAVISVVHLAIGLEHFTEELNSPALLNAALKDTATRTSLRNISSPREIMSDNLAWHETEYDAEVPGAQLHYIVRVIARPHLRVILFGFADMRKFEQHRPLVEEALNNFRVIE